MLPSMPGQAGAALETVMLARDELANTAWAIEQSVTSDEELLVDRREAWAKIRPELSSPGELAAYAVQTIVPNYWLPLLPVEHAPESIRFRLSTLLQPLEGSEDLDLDAKPLGRLLTPGQWIHEEEVPRDGAALSRRPVLARWYDGSWHGWVRRAKNAGSGESSSGLAFDIVRPSEPWS